MLTILFNLFYNLLLIRSFTSGSGTFILSRWFLLAQFLYKRCVGSLVCADRPPHIVFFATSVSHRKKSRNLQTERTTKREKSGSGDDEKRRIKREPQLRCNRAITAVHSRSCIALRKEKNTVHTLLILPSHSHSGSNSCRGNETKLHVCRADRPTATMALKKSSDTC